MRSNDATLTKKRDCCPNCGSVSHAFVYRDNFSVTGIHEYFVSHYEGSASHTNLDNLIFELAQCSNCALTYQVHVPTNDLLSQIYDVWIPKSTREELRVTRNLGYYRYLSEQVQFFIQTLNLPPHEINVLDFGFGWSEWAKMAMAYGCNVSGSELSTERIAYAQSIGLKCIEIHDLPANHFHFINTEQVFEHLVDPHDILKRLVTALTDSGIIKISVPDATNSLRKLRRSGVFSSLSPDQIMPIAPLEHINCFNYKTLVTLANTVGLKPRHPSFKKLYNSSSGWLDLKNALRLIVRPFYRHVFPKSTFIYFSLK